MDKEVRQKIIEAVRKVPPEKRICSKCFYEAVDAGIEREAARLMSEASYASFHTGTEALCFTCESCWPLAMAAHGTVVSLRDVPND